MEIYQNNEQHITHSNCAIQGRNLAREHTPDYVSFFNQVMGRNLAREYAQITHLNFAIQGGNLAREYAPDYGIVFWLLVGARAICPLASPACCHRIDGCSSKARGVESVGAVRT